MDEQNKTSILLGGFMGIVYSGEVLNWINTTTMESHTGSSESAKESDAVSS
jgi:hypothetical protein